MQRRHSGRILALHTPLGAQMPRSIWVFRVRTQMPRFSFPVLDLGPARALQGACLRSHWIWTFPFRRSGVSPGVCSSFLEKIPVETPWAVVSEKKKKTGAKCPQRLDLSIITACLGLSRVDGSVKLGRSVSAAVAPSKHPKSKPTCYGTVRVLVQVLVRGL